MRLHRLHHLIQRYRLQYFSNHERGCPSSSPLAGAIKCHNQTGRDTYTLQRPTTITIGENAYNFADDYIQAAKCKNDTPLNKVKFRIEDSLRDYYVYIRFDDEHNAITIGQGSPGGDDCQGIATH